MIAVSVSADALAWAGITLTFLSTVLWGIYVYFTIKTFKEIRRQTELQSDAFLVVRIVDAQRPPTTSPAELEVTARHLLIGGFLSRSSGNLKCIGAPAADLIAKWSAICSNN